MQSYVDGEPFRRVARCDCGWHGAARWSRGSADVDAAIHAAQTGHCEFTGVEGNFTPIVQLKAS